MCLCAILLRYIFTYISLTGYESGIIQASSFRTYHTPLNKQVDYVNSMRAAREFSSRVSDSLKIDIFPYSVFYMFFEQYLNIWRTALINLAIAIVWAFGDLHGNALFKLIFFCFLEKMELAGRWGSVLTKGIAVDFVPSLIFKCSFWSSAIILLVLTMIVVDLMGVMAILKIQLNAVSVVNLIMSVGIAVEFCVHITHAFSVSSGDKDQRVKEALGTMGASVFSELWCQTIWWNHTNKASWSDCSLLLKDRSLCGLLLPDVPGIGTSWFLTWTCIFNPVVLSVLGPPSRCVLVEKQGDRPSVSSQ
ncbi:hypothetical protein Pint_09226 [Pistacia integerrima]|uniref:Uncharacterized protein n=1 Tax=Pistacia integerrima TaxID=434235 RepID=A0ACC0XTN0_9ROSI|nr:hypothetical protein Pint_09226 [Pistacia integerrima]